MIHVATSGYSYPDWIGPFYPEKTPRSKMLEYYSQHFNFTEINSSYYHVPSAQTVESLLKRTPETFRFAVKAHRAMTHERTATGADCRHFAEVLKPMMESGRLICVLLQFPYSFHPNSENIGWLERLRDWLAPFRLAVEFRNGRWISQETFAWLRERELAYVSVDGPPLKGLVGRHAVATAGIAYVRFHGRNSRKWWEHEQAYQRYDYLYKEEELAEWVEPLKKLDSIAGETFVCFNNHFVGQAVVNARMLSKLLQEK